MSIISHDSEHSIANKIYKYYENIVESPRHHLGCSISGHNCERYIWLSFRDATPRHFEGRILRLFGRGQDEEPRVVKELKAIGIAVTETGSNQRRVTLSGHVSGSIDGIIKSGVPEAPKKQHILEIKTHSLKSFEQLLKDGVMVSKPQHYAQMQLYMKGTSIDRALYFSVCKDDDRIYTERVRYDAVYAEKLLGRVERLSLEERLPPPLSTKPDWWECKICDYHDFCHVSHIAKSAHCRTCSHVTPLANGEWHCQVFNDAIPASHQFTGCDNHLLHPDLVPWQFVSNDNEEAVWVIDGVNVRNGPGDAFTFTSKEIIANHKLCAAAANGDPVGQLRQMFDGKIVG